MVARKTLNCSFPALVRLSGFKVQMWPDYCYDSQLVFHPLHNTHASTHARRIPLMAQPAPQMESGLALSTEVARPSNEESSHGSTFSHEIPSEIGLGMIS